MNKQNPFADKSLEELKLMHTKYKKIFAIFSGIMSVSVVFTIYSAYSTKNWSLLGTLAIILAFLPMYISIKNIDKEIKDREQKNKLL